MKLVSNYDQGRMQDMQKRAMNVKKELRVNNIVRYNKNNQKSKTPIYVRGLFRIE